MTLNAGAIEHTAAPRSSGTLWRVYVAGWLVLGTAATSYLAVAAFDPALVQSFGSTAGARVADARAEKLAAEVETLRSTDGRLQAELTGIKTTVAQKSEPPAGAGAAPPDQAAPPSVASAPEHPGLIRVGKVRTIDATPPQQQAAAPSAPPAEVAPPVAAAPTEPAAKAKRVAGRIPPLPTRVERPTRPSGTATPPQRVATGPRPRILNQSDAGTTVVTTGSIPVPPAAKPAPREAEPPKAPPKITFGAPIVRPATARDLAPTFPPPTPDSATAITLSRASTLDGLRASWLSLTNKHPTLLGGLQPRYAREPGGTYRLLAGPFDDRVAADRLCGALRVDNIPCGVGNYTGNAL